MSNKIAFDRQAQEKILSGINTLTKAVATTLGPRGRNVAIDRGYDMLVCHDGVSVAKAIDLKDKQENAGVRLLREAAQKQVDEVGDGTTVVTILGAAIINECVKITATGVNPMSLRPGLESGAAALCLELDQLATPVKTLEEKIQIATISAEDQELGKLIGETLHRIGIDGVVTVEESASADTVVEHQEGMQFDKGFVSPYFITNPDRSEATIEDPYILLTDKKVSNVHELVPFMEKFGDVSNSLVVIAPEIADSALATFVLNKVQGRGNILCVGAPLFGQKQKDFLADIAVLTGGTVITEDAGMRFEEIGVEMLGRATRVTATKDATLIVGGLGGAEAVSARVDALRSQLEREEAAFEQEKLRERIAKLGSGVAVIKVGGHTELEMKERKERALDSVAATKAAIEEGVVPGGETAYLTVAKKLGSATTDTILKSALIRPLAQLIENAGLDPVDILPKMVKPTMGVDVTDGVVKNLLKAGIIDPVKVCKCAIRNAVSVAIQVMTIDALITPEEEEKK